MMPPPVFCRAGMGCLVCLTLTVRKHSGSVSPCRALPLASSLARAIAFLYSLLSRGRSAFSGHFLINVCIVFFYVLRASHQKGLALNQALVVSWRTFSVRLCWTVARSSCLLSRRSSSARIRCQLALSYLGGLSMHSRHWISAVIDRATGSPEEIVRCVTLRPVLLLEIARSRVVPVGWEPEGGWVIACGFLTFMFL